MTQFRAVYPISNEDTNALPVKEIGAAEHLVRRGAALTLATALCLGRWEDVSRLVMTANDRDKQFGFVLAALNGKADALQRMIDVGGDVNHPSEDLYSHGTPHHHAVCSGSLDTAQVLMEAGAVLGTIDRAWQATPLGWAEYYQREAKDAVTVSRYAKIAEYLRTKGES